MFRTLLFLGCTSLLHAQLSHFEARHTHSISLTPDGGTLLVLNSPDSSLSLFDVSDRSRAEPLLIGEIPVGLEPVSVRARTAGEAWVVNEVSDSISVVSLVDGTVIATLQVPDEPADVYFAAGKAFVTCSGNRQIRVFDAMTRAPLATIPLEGVTPRAMTGSVDGQKLYVSFLYSGNNTTILPANLAPAPPSPTNTTLPVAPRTALIVPASDSRITWKVQDHDVAEINTTTFSVNRVIPGIGTHLFDLQIHPVTGKLWVANSESLNLTRFEPQLNGNVSIHRLTEVSLTDSTAPVHFSLNSSIPRATTPNPASVALALAQPTGLVFSPDASRIWTTAFNSDRVAEINPTDGSITSRIDVRLPHPSGLANTSRFMRGPRSLAISNTGDRLYVLNKLSNTLSIINTATRTVLAEVATGSNDPTPTTIRVGRGFLFDARLSGNGTISCATCHIDADRDGLAWDLGDPGGQMLTLQGANLSAHQTNLINRVMHPMKGPMVTQTLRGLATNQSSVTTPPAAVTPKFHWRGDMPSIQSFNSTFTNLMGGNRISTDDMNAMAAYLLTIRLHPNPNRNLDRSLPISFNGGNAVAGRDLFNDHIGSHCATCHPLASGTDQNIDLRREVNGTQEMKNPPLRTVYQRFGIFNPTRGASSPAGFGLGSDGTGSSLPLPHFYQLDNLSTTQQLADLSAFLLCFDTGTAPSVGRTLTIRATDAPNSATELTTLEAQAVANACDLVVKVKINGVIRSFFYQIATRLYRSDRTSEASLTRAALIARAGNEPLTFTGVIPGDGPRLGGDVNLNGILDGDEPIPSLQISSNRDFISLSWPATAKDWFLQAAPSPAGPWEPLNTENPSTTPIGDLKTRFFRLHQTR